MKDIGEANVIRKESQGREIIYYYSKNNILRNFLGSLTIMTLKLVSTPYDVNYKLNKNKKESLFLNLSMLK